MTLVDLMVARLVAQMDVEWVGVTVVSSVEW